MSNDAIIELNDVTMRFNLSKERVETLKEYVVRLAKHQLQFDAFEALKHATFSISKGSAIGLIGRNGCGKSTTLKLISGIYYPSEGSVTVRGSIAPLIELGAGFDPDLTARENIYLNGAVLGYDHEFMSAHYDQIIEFAELIDFVDVPVKNFSSGMVARLGFSIATMVSADILIVDEILAVGDIAFQQKCNDRMAQMLAGGTTLILVSHNIDDVKRLCDRVIYLEHGIIKDDGPTLEVCDHYLNDISNG